MAVVVALLGGYFTYQWWFNPNRAIKRQLDNLAVALSVSPDSRGDMDRLARIAGLRNYFAPDVHVKTAPASSAGPELTSRDALLGAVAAWNPSTSGWHVDFVDLQITLESSTTARVYLTVEVITSEPGTSQATVDSREARVGHGQTGRRLGHYERGTCRATAASLKPVTIHRGVAPRLLQRHHDCLLSRLSVRQNDGRDDRDFLRHGLSACLFG